jgi:hypothetical protein
LIFEDTTPNLNSYNIYIAIKLSNPVYIQFIKLKIYYMLAHPSLKAIYHLKDLAINIIINSIKLCPCKTIVKPASWPKLTK